MSTILIAVCVAWAMADAWAVWYVTRLRKKNAEQQDEIDHLRKLIADVPVMNQRPKWPV